eukprot:613298-Prorocentrum_lima.AAC.1
MALPVHLGGLVLKLEDRLSATSWKLNMEWLHDRAIVYKVVKGDEEKKTMVQECATFFDADTLPDLSTAELSVLARNSIQEAADTLEESKGNVPIVPPLLDNSPIAPERVTVGEVQEPA